MRLGVLLPTFADSAEPALAAAEAAAAAGLDGVFAYDHLWPMGSPTRPALAPFPVLAAVARRHETLFVGPLVARIGLVSTSHLLESFAALDAVAPGRVVAALGTGDAKSAAENDAYGLAVLSADERRAELAVVARAVAARGEVWVGAGAPATNALCRELGATLNLWGVSGAAAAAAAAEGPVSWAGPPGEDLEARLDEVKAAGATWAVLTPGVDARRLADWRVRRVK